MTLKELGRHVKTVEYPGEYDHIPDEVAALAFLQRAPYNAHYVGTTPDKISAILAQPTWTGVIGTFFGQLRADREVALLTARHQQALLLASIQIQFEAAIQGVTVEVLQEMKLETHRINEALRFEAGKAQIQIAASEAEYKQQTAFDRDQALIREEWAKKKLAAELEMDRMRTRHAQRKNRLRRKAEEADTE